MRGLLFFLFTTMLHMFKSALTYEDDAHGLKKWDGFCDTLRTALLLRENRAARAINQKPVEEF